MRFVVVLFVAIVSSLAMANPVAVVVRAGGDVTRSNTDVAAESLTRRDSLSEGDQISTGNDSYATLKFSDQSVVDLGANTTLTITRFRPDGDGDERKVLLELLSGKLRTITGSLAQDPKAFDLRTAHASIGVRGTEFEVVVVSSVETQVQWHAGTVLVRSLEFQGQILELTEAAQAATVTLGNPATYIDGLSTDSMGPFNADLLGNIDAIPAPPLFHVIVPPVVVPQVLSLSENGNTPVGGTMDDTNQEPIEAFVALVKQNRWSEARLLANELQDRFEGLPRFDLYYGLLLMAEGNHDEAIFAFERVLVFSPDQHRARLELGRAYFLSGNYARSRNALEQVLLADPPSQVRQNVRSLLAQVDAAERRAQTQTQFGGGLEAGWDSNGNSGSNLDGDLDPNLLGLTNLANASLPIDSIFTRWSITTGASKPTSQNASSGFIVDFTSKNYLETSLSDTNALTLSATMNGQKGRWKTSVPVSGQWAWLDGQSWQGSVNVAASHQYRIWGPLWAGVKIGSQVNVSLNSDNLSSAKDLAGVLFDAQERGRVHTFSSLYLQTMQSGQDDGHNEWRGLANRYQLNWSLPWRLQANLVAEHQWRRYKADDPFFTVNDISTELKRRQDQILTSELQIGWAPAYWLTTQSKLNWEWVNSNINAYGRDRLTVSQAVTIRF